MQSYKTIDEYLETQPVEYQKVFQKLRKFIKKIVPKCEESIGRWMPWFKVNGKWVVWFAGFKKHMSFFPHSGSILCHFEKEIQWFTHTKAAIHFTVENPLPDELVKKIIEKKIEYEILKGRKS